MLPIVEDVINGLSANPKRISSRWFYDSVGDKLFQDIMELPEYYLTRAEYSVLELNAKDIFAPFARDKQINIVELGAGDGKKTRVLFDYLISENRAFKYFPIDISQNALDKLCNALKTEYQNMNILGLQTDYFSALKSDALNKTENKLVLFLGSNVGNLSDQEAPAFFTELFSVLKSGDKVLIGFDRVKDPEVILAAYNDAAGVTRDFNLNLLNRLNKELGADFNLQAWEHQPEYSVERKAALSFIVSKEDQYVNFSLQNKTFHFQKGERIHTEISRKFDADDMNLLASKAGFKVLDNFNHPDPLYTDSFWEKP
ncbi:MAG: L-histidine N(alpha)-methyltransferase [Bacteroidia bacterium]